MRSRNPRVRSFGLSWSTVALLLSVAAMGCGRQGINPTGPSSTGDTSAKPGVSALSSAGATVVSFENFDPGTLVVTMKTTTTADLGQPYIDDGKIHLQILVDAAGNPVPCGTTGGTWVRFDNQGGGMDVTSAMTSLDVELDDLSSRGVGVNDASCGDSICIRAQYVTGGGNPKVDTHFSEPTAFDIDCGTCTFSQGHWKTHGPIPTGNNSNEWPVNSLTLGTVVYTDLELLSILNASVGGNGLISLAHQLIAAKLNVANGADDSAIAATIAAADALIGGLVVPPVGGGSLAPSATGALTTLLDDYNNGIIGPGHCETDESN